VPEKKPALSLSEKNAGRAAGIGGGAGLMVIGAVGLALGATATGIVVLVIGAIGLLVAAVVGR